MRYLFYIAKLYSITVVQPLMDYLETTTDNEYVILVSEKVLQLLKAENIWQDKRVITDIREGIAFNPDFCITPGNYIDFRLPGLKIEIFHGLGIEKDSHYVIRHFFDVYLTSGPVVTERYNKLQQKHGYFLVRETGWLKMDYIVNFPFESIREKLGYDIEKRIILYAPTIGKRTKSGVDLLPVLKEIIKDNEICLVKFHELIDKELVEDIRQSQNDRIRIVDAYDITPYLYLADLLISDTSSVLYEIMSLDKPVITYRTKDRKDKGIDISSPAELRPAIDRTFADPGEFSPNRKRHLQEVNPYLDGSISKNIVRTLEKIVTDNELPKKKKPLNLFRKAIILKNEFFRKGYLK